jgi:hypothetical protein
MIEFPGLPNIIKNAGPEGASLVSLAGSPTSRAVAGILAERSQLEIQELVSDKHYVLYKCIDRATYDIPMHSPFGMFCVDTSNLSSENEAQDLLQQIIGLLRDRDLHYHPVLLLINTENTPLEPLLDLTDIPLVLLNSRELVSVLLAHPPHMVLMKHISKRVPLRTVNPYIYKGPVGPRMFFGRHRQIEQLCDLRFSYALVGPRAIGKTSLMNRAYERLKLDGKIAICVQYSPAMREDDLLYQIMERFVREHGAEQVLLARFSIHVLERLIEDYAVRYRHGEPHKRGTVAVFVDEADELSEKCPRLAESFQRCHNNGWARFVLLGYKYLRKTVNDISSSPLMNVLHEFTLSGLSLDECGALVTEPMDRLEVKLGNPRGVVETIYQESGASPSRIQLLCYYMVEELSNTGERVITPEFAQKAILLPNVRRQLAEWFNDSTTFTEKWLAALASFYVPCSEDELADKARNDLPEITGQEIRAELLDLITANVLDYQRDGDLNFTFPAMRDLAGPLGNPKEAMTELRRMARQSLARS